MRKRFYLSGRNLAGCNTFCFQVRPGLPFLTAGRLEADDGFPLPGKIRHGSMTRRSVWHSAAMPFGQASYTEVGGRGGPSIRGAWRLIGRTRGGMTTKLHAVTDADGRPIRFFMTAAQVSDYTGAAALIGSLPKAGWLLADRGYDADW